MLVGQVYRTLQKLLALFFVGAQHVERLLKQASVACRLLFSHHYRSIHLSFFMLFRCGAWWRVNVICTLDNLNGRLLAIFEPFYESSQYQW